MSKSEFEKYATGHAGISSLKLHQFKAAAQGSISPTIIEERQMNVAAMDVFSRLMMDRIIFLGCPVYDDVANIIQAQLLFLESTEPDKDIQIYINSPGGSVTAGLGIYDTMQLISSDVATICTGCGLLHGAVLLTAGAMREKTAALAPKIRGDDPPTAGRRRRTGASTSRSRRVRFFAPNRSYTKHFALHLQVNPSKRRRMPTAITDDRP